MSPDFTICLDNSHLLPFFLRGSKGSRVSGNRLPAIDWLDETTTQTSQKKTNTYIKEELVDGKNYKEKNF